MNTDHLLLALFDPDEIEASDEPRCSDNTYSVDDPARAESHRLDWLDDVTRFSYTGNSMVDAEFIDFDSGNDNVLSNCGFDAHVDHECAGSLAKGTASSLLNTRA